MSSASHFATLICNVQNLFILSPNFGCGCFRPLLFFHRVEKRSEVEVCIKVIVQCKKKFISVSFLFFGNTLWCGLQWWVLQDPNGWCSGTSKLELQDPIQWNIQYRVIRKVRHGVWSSIISSFFEQGYRFFMIIVAEILEIYWLFTVFVYLIRKGIYIALKRDGIIREIASKIDLAWGWMVVIFISN